MSSPAYDGRGYIADTSAWERSSSELVSTEWREAVSTGQIASCAPVTMELLYSTRDAAGFDRLGSRLGGFESRWIAPPGSLT